MAEVPYLQTQDSNRTSFATDAMSRWSQDYLRPLSIQSYYAHENIS